MMSKASYMMQDHLRHSYSLVTDVAKPHSFFARGRLPFPRGLTAISILFHNQKPADVYAHRYFIEKQSNPSQPSPQMHITEESQSIMKVMGGLRYMKDDSSKLDNTMYISSDYTVDAEGRVLYYFDAKAEKKRKMQKEATERQMKKMKEEEERLHQESADLNEARQTTNTDRISQFRSSLLNEIKNPYIKADRKTMDAEGLKSKLTSAAATSTQGGSGFGDGDNLNVSDKGRTSFSTGNAGASRGGVSGGRTIFPSCSDAVEDVENSYRFFFEAARMNRSADVSVYKADLNDDDFDHLSTDEARRKVPMPLFNMKGCYTVLYNPVETNELTFVQVIRKLNAEERVVKAIVVPTRESWEYVQVWADAFPDALIYAAGPIPIAEGDVEAGGAAAAAPSTDAADASVTPSSAARGLKDMGNGVFGMEFPEANLEEETAAAQDEEARLKREMREALRKAQSREDGSVEEDPVDVLWSNPSALQESLSQAKAGLRASDAHRVRLLDDLLEQKPNREDKVELTPTLQLLRVPGDAMANEYVLYDANSHTLACRELFHGGYGDLDPVNSWFCRVWFKFMKHGDYKRIDLVPRFKWLNVLKQGSLSQLQRWVDWLTSTRPIDVLVFAHGTPPLSGGAVNALREQWGLPPLSHFEQTMKATQAYLDSLEADPAESHKNTAQDRNRNASGKKNFSNDRHHTEVDVTKQTSMDNTIGSKFANNVNRKLSEGQKKKEKPDLSWLYKSS